MLELTLSLVVATPVFPILLYKYLENGIFFMSLIELQAVKKPINVLELVAMVPIMWRLYMASVHTR